MSSADWQNTPFTLPLLLSGLLCGWVAYVAWRRRAVPGAAQFAVLMAALSGWALINLVEKSLVHYELRRAVSSVLYIFIVSVPGAWLVFAVRFAGQNRWLPPRLVPLLFLEPLLILALVFTNPFHGLIHAATEMKTDGTYAVMVIRHGPFFYVNAAYNWVLFTAGAALLVTGVLRQPGSAARRLAVVLGAMLVPVLGNAAWVLGLQPRQLTDLTPVYFAVPGLAAAWLLFRVRVFDVLPIARDLVLDCLGDAVFVLDTRNHILDANLAARSLLPDSRRVRKQPLADALPELGPYLPARPDAVRNATEIQLRSVSPGRFWDLHALPLVDHGATIGGLVRLTDVTKDVKARKQAEEALKEADRRKDEFLAMLAHELRNPLAPIRNALEVMRMTGTTGPLVESARQMIERQVQQVVRLVDDLLDVSRITRGKIDLRKGPAQLAAVVEQALETSRPLLEARRHKLTVSLPAESVDLDADATRLAQVFSNLLNNAAKFTEEGGRIELTAARQDQEVVVRVRDSGIGMSAEMLTRAFDLFAQADRSLDRAHGGLGIGLTLARRLVQLHGGSVEAFSDGPGKGTELVVRLPVLRGTRPVERTPRRENGPRTPRRILVVDDNVDGAESLAQSLKMAGHQVCTVFSGPAALDVARSYRPEAVLLDIGMPGMDGYEVARRLREEPGLEKILLVALTGYGQEEDRRRSRQATIDYHLVKPVGAETLEALLAGPQPAAR
jgi:signal transduction histidine kinase/ActR/RegA family two-component response regulator